MELDNSSCFIVGTVEMAGDVGEECREETRLARCAALAQDVDRALGTPGLADGELPVGYRRDCPAHMSANMRPAHVRARAAVAASLDLVFNEEHGLGRIIQPATDGNGNECRLHGQDGSRAGLEGDSSHFKHRDGFKSRERDGTGVQAIAAEQHAWWDLEREGVGRCRVKPMHASRMYMLLFDAAANAMATHAVGPLPPTTAPRHGLRERYSLSYSWAYRVNPLTERKYTYADLLACIRSKPRFASIVTIAALAPTDHGAEIAI